MAVAGAPEMALYMLEYNGQEYRCNRQTVSNRALLVIAHPLITDIFYPQITQICADFLRVGCLAQEGRCVCAFLSPLWFSALKAQNIPVP
jgi:hypothetical protein